MRHSIFVAGAALALLLAGCGEDKKDAAPAGTDKPAASAAPTGAATATVAANDDVPSEADFEEEAEKDINSVENVESELAKLEKEIGE